jgi:hypothetical protein
MLATMQQRLKMSNVPLVPASCFSPFIFFIDAKNLIY